MKIIRTLLAITLGLCASGCPTYQINDLPESTPLSQPVPISASGAYVHGPSGVVFPERVGEFQRVAILRYDTNGLDVSGGYNGGTPSCLIRATLYVYPTPRMNFVGASPDVVRSLEEQWLNGAFTQAKNEIKASHPTAELVSEGPISRGSSEGLSGLFAIGNDLSEVEVYLSQLKWFVMYRHTYPKSCEAEAKAKVAQLHEMLSGVVQPATPPDGPAASAAGLPSLAALARRG